MDIEQISARQFCEEVGIQNGTLSNIINGRNDASYDVVRKILARYTRISADWFIRDKGPMYVDEKKEQPVAVAAPKDIEKIVIFFSDGTFREMRDIHDEGQINP